MESTASSTIPPTLDRYLDGATAVSHPVRIALSGDALAIDDTGGRRLATWPIATLRVIDENQQNGSMIFAFSDAEGARLILYPSDERRALLASKASLSGWRWHRGLGELRTVAIWSGIMIAIAVAGYFGWRPLAGIIAAAVPWAWEERLGETYRAVFIDSMKTCTGSDGIAALQALVERLTPETLDGSPITVDVVRQGQPNALALPGNHVLVFDGLILEAETPEMLAGVIAHEIAHLDLDHPTRRIVEQMGLGIIITAAFGGSDVGNAGLMLASLSYSRDAESEADDRAIELLNDAGIRSDGLALFFRKIEGDMPFEIPDWLSTHPDLANRADANPGSETGDPAMTKPEWDSVRAICDRSAAGKPESADE
jgi:Zn-dependent protease with chaperone function